MRLKCVFFLFFFNPFFEPKCQFWQYMCNISQIIANMGEMCFYFFIATFYSFNFSENLKKL